MRLVQSGFGVKSRVGVKSGIPYKSGANQVRQLNTW